MLPKIVDLFSGCGGLALGFEKAGFEIVTGIEIMPEACETINYNLCWKKGIKGNHICGDITQMEPDALKGTFGEEGCIVIGGPPCQAYSKAGRGKLHSLGEDRVNTSDARGYLYQDFLRFVYGLDAKAVLMENVPDAVSYGDLNIPEIVSIELEKHGYNVFWTILNSADFGVPQIRTRLFLYAVKSDLDITIPMPMLTHNSDSQVFYEKRFKSFMNYNHYKKPDFYNDIDEEWVTVSDAFSDLPVLFKSTKDINLNSPMNIKLNYSSRIQNKFQKIMRTWDLSEMDGVTGNTFRNTERDFVIFEQMKQGDNFVQASEIADRIYKKKIIELNIEDDKHMKTVLKNKIIPPYDRDNFEGKWRKLIDSQPSHTILAHLCKDTYSHIHPWEPRGISVREAARLQSFPDNFIFSCSMGDAYKQIGNAVPPLMAYRVALPLFESFSRR